MLRHRTPRLLAAAATTALVAAVGVAAPASAHPRPAPPTGTAPVLVASFGLSPLHVAAAPGGHALLVADAFLGTVTRLELLGDGGTEATTVASGLGFAPSVTTRGNRLYVVRTAGQGGPEEQSPTFLSKISREGGPVDLVDLLALERRFNPDQQTPGMDAESNPYDVISYDGGFIVADAAANALFRIDADGTASVLTALPLVRTGPCATRPDQGQIGCDPVPTGIALGPDGYLYVSGLGAFVAGQLWKVDPQSGRIVASLSTPPGSPPLTDVAVAEDGAVYVSSIVAGRVFRLQAGTWTSTALAAPAGLLASHGTLYVGSAPAALQAEAEETGGPAPTGPPPPGRIYAVPAGAFR